MSANHHNRLKETRFKHGLSQDDLATLCNISQVYVSMLERGARGGSRKVWERIASELGVGVEALAKGTNKDRSDETVVR